MGLAGATVALLLWWQGVLTPLEAVSWRWRVGFFARPVATSAQIRIIALDQRSLDWGRAENNLSWPWPREAYEVILSFCRRGKARVVAVDLLFSEPSIYGVTDDQALAASLRRHGPVVGSLALSSVAGGERQWPAAIPSPSLEVAGLDSWRQGATPAAFAGGAFPLPELGNSFSRLANVSTIPDQDGVFRRVPLLSLLGGRPVPSLGLAAYLAGQPDQKAIPLAIGSQALAMGHRHVPIDGSGNSILRFRGPSGTYRTLSAAAVIQSELRLRNGEKPAIDPAELAGTYVFFGLSAPGLYDLRPIPIDGVYPGVEIHATVLDNLLADDFLSDLPPLATVAVTVVLSLLAGLLIRFCTTVWQSLLLCTLLLPLPLLAGFAAYPLGAWLQVAVASGGVVFALGGGAMLNFAMEGRQRRYIKRAFQQYLHPAVIDELVAHPERLNLGGEKRELSIFFADLQGFSTISEQLDPENLTALLNEFLTAMTDIIQDNGGTIDKYEGDAIVAFWNAPLAQPDHARRAVRAALACQAKLAELRPFLRHRYGHDLFMRVGINTGPAVVGNLGSRHRFNYTMLGDAVNLAARLEGINKQFGTFILVSDMTLAALGSELPVREISRVAVVGRNQPVRIYEPLTAAGAADGALVGQFAAGLAHYYSGRFPEGAEAFAAIADHDPPAAIYLRRCRQLVAEPPVDWDGIWRMTEK